MMMNCTKGAMDDSNFGKPMPIIGLYIVGATFLCIIAMVADLVNGIKSKQFWIPAKYFSINAASLTIIGVAVKLSIDLNTSMPSKVDQLAKLATSAFICAVLVNILPSMGRLKKGELLANRIALAILIITSIVNLCIQLKTGVIHAFKGAHVFMIVMMSYFLYVCHNHISSFAHDKNYVLVKFEKMQQQALEELRADSEESKEESIKMKEYLMKFSMMAQSGCPQFMLSRSYPSVALSQHNLLPASVLFFVLFATTITHGEKMVGLNTCSGDSDYGWSVLLILITQGIIAVVLGLVIPLCRMIYVWKATTCPVRDTSPQRNEEPLQVEKHFWLKHLDETKEYLVFPYIEHWYRSPTVYAMKVTLSYLILIFQSSYAYIYPSLPLPWVICKGTNRKPRSDLRPYFFITLREEKYKFLDWEYMVESSSHVTHKFISDGEKEEPKRLIGFLKDHLSYDFGGVLSFESDQVSIPDVEHPPNCWALSVLTLTCIATALPNIDPTLKKQLRMCVNEGLVYVKLVEDHLNATRDLCNIRYAAHIVWRNLNLRKHRWLSVDLENLARNSKSPTEVLSWLAESAKKKFHDYSSSSDEVYRRNYLCGWTHLKSPIINCCKAVAAHSMYKICQTALQDCQNEGNLDPSSHDIFEKLRKAIVDILGACFTNLRQCILLECNRSTVENRRETALRMLKVFGETKKVMDILEEKAMKLPLSDDQGALLDGWRSYLTHHRDVV